ncbi:MAG: zinc ABC transporter substrate-binding protein [Polaromonas sp.]|nr:zinc ABC transporter substrate-binding protein [Polaromonas sp.]
MRQIQREKIHAVFVRNMSNPKLPAQLSRDAGTMVGPTLYIDSLSAPGGPASSSLQLMRHHVSALVRRMANKLN